MAAKKTVKKPAAKATKSTAAKKVVKKPAAKVAKKAPAKKAPAKKAVKAAPKATKAKAAPAHISVGAKPFTKSQLIAAIAEHTGIARKDATNVVALVANIIDAHLSKGPAVFSWPGLFKMKVVKKPATKARKGINPFTGEPTTFKAKPASKKVKILPLKQLKEMVS